MTEFFHVDADLTGAGEFFDATGLVLGQTFTFGVEGEVSSLRFRAPAAFTGGTNRVALYQTTDDDPPAGAGAGTELANVEVTTYSPDTWVVMPITPVAVVPGVPYRSAWWNSVGRYRALGAFWSSGQIVRGNLLGIRDNVPTAGFDLHQGVFQVSGSITYPKDSFNASSYFVDLGFDADYFRISPFREPELASNAGLYSFGMDVESDESTEYLGMYWYRPFGEAAADVTARLYNTATEAVLASGSAVAADLEEGWNFIPYSTSHTTTANVTGACETAGAHAYDNSVTLPQTDASGHVTMVQTRYQSGGGFPATDWGSGWHGIDMRFRTGGAPPVGGQERWGLKL